MAVCQHHPTAAARRRPECLVEGAEPEGHQRAHEFRVGTDTLVDLPGFSLWLSTTGPQPPTGPHPEPGTLPADPQALLPPHPKPHRLEAPKTVECQPLEETRPCSCTGWKPPQRPRWDPSNWDPPRA